MNVLSPSLCFVLGSLGRLCRYDFSLSAIPLDFGDSKIEIHIKSGTLNWNCFFCGRRRSNNYRQFSVLLHVLNLTSTLPIYFLLMGPPRPPPHTYPISPPYMQIDNTYTIHRQYIHIYNARKHAYIRGDKVGGHR